MSLDILRQELREFKSNLLELSMDKNLQEDELVKLVNSSINKDNILEVLILMYSNSKSDIQSVKSYQVKTLIEIVDKLEASMVEYNSQIITLDNKFTSNIKDIFTRLDSIDETIDYRLKTKFINTWYGKVMFGIGTAIFIVICFFYLYRLDPEGAKFTSNIFNSLFDKTIEVGSGGSVSIGGSR